MTCSLAVWCCRNRISHLFVNSLMKEHLLWDPVRKGNWKNTMHDSQALKRDLTLLYLRMLCSGGETVLTCPYWLDLNLRLIYLHSKLTKPSFSPSTLKLLTIIMCEISREAISSSFLWEWDRLTEGLWLNWQLVLCCCIWQTVTGRDLIPEVNAPLIGHERGSFILNQLANVID